MSMNATEMKNTARANTIALLSPVLKENEAVSSEIEKLLREQLMHSDKYEGDIGGYDDSENQVDADIPPMEDEPF